MKKYLLLAFIVMIGFTFARCNNGEVCRGDDHISQPVEYRGVWYCAICQGIIKDSTQMIDSDGFNWGTGEKVKLCLGKSKK